MDVLEVVVPDPSTDTVTVTLDDADIVLDVSVPDTVEQVIDAVIGGDDTVDVTMSDARTDEVTVTVAGPDVVDVAVGSFIDTAIEVTTIGERGPQGVQGEPGPQNLFVQPNDPAMAQPGVWVQTGLGPAGNDWTMWIEDGT